MVKSKKRLRVRAPLPPSGPNAATKPAPYQGFAGPWYWHVIAVLLLLVGTCALYYPALGLGFFHLDDPTYVLTNPWIKSLTWTNVRHILTTPYFANFSPLHLLTYLLDYQIAGESARTFHLSNLIWGGLVAGGVYLLGVLLLSPAAAEITHSPAPRRFDPAPLLAFLAAALFVVHPAHVEAVAWISSRKDLIAAFFALLTMLAYFLHRRDSTRWFPYVLSVLLFTLAVAGKMSVVVLPGVLVVFDWLVEKRRQWSILWDKIPFVLVAFVFALPTLQAQPATQQHFSLQVLGESTLRHLWLLTGLGQYVLFHSKPSSGLLKLFGVIGPLVLVIVPLLFQRRWPALPIALFYWILLALLPSQILSFINPVADRYIFFPSTAAVLLAAWAVARIQPRLPVSWRFAPWLAALLLAGVWTAKTVAYLGEWRDPRSVWFAATAKSNDYLVDQYLGTHYQDQSDQLAANLKSPQRAQTIAMARSLMTNQVQLQALLQEWEKKQMGPQTQAYRRYLNQLAREQFEEALRHRGTRLAPNLYFRLGKLAYEQNDRDAARAYFLKAQSEAQKHTSVDVREEVAVRGHHALALVEWNAKNYAEALRWLTMAQQEQARFHRTYIPDLAAQRQQLERIIASQPK